MLLERLKLFCQPVDGRYEDLKRGNPVLNVVRDFTAGLVVAMIAIPLAMGFAIASGLRPEQGIVGGAVAGLVGALFGGSKYQVYGPTAAFIPIIGAIMHAHDHGFLVLCSLLAGATLWLMGLSGFGKIVKLVPHSIVVGFTIGIAVTIALSQGVEVFGLHAKSGYQAIEKAHVIATHYGSLEIEAVALAVGTLVLMKILLRVSIFIPGPLVALGIGIGLTQTLMAQEGLVLVRDKYGAIPPMALHFTPPSFAALTSDLGDVVYYAIAIVFVAAIESLLCSRMADRLASNTGIPYNPDKELWGQGWVMAIVPLLNGFPHTGALARTATNIKLGAVSPLAGIFKAVLKLLLAFYVARYLELVPMACIGGVLLYVATNMVKRSEVTEAFAMGRAHVWLMVFTAVGVIALDFLRGVLAALLIYGIWQIVVRSRAHRDPSHTLGIYERARGPAHASAQPPMRAHAVEARGSAREQSDEPLRAVLDTRGPSQRDDLVAGRRAWLSNIRRPASLSRSAFVHGQANVIGRVVLGDYVHIAAGASVRADEGTPFFVGSNSNIQDGVVIHALKNKQVLVDGQAWAVYIGRNVSVAHDALVHGPCFVGDHTFVGFKAVVHDAVVGAHCFLGIGAVVVGVEIPDGRYVPNGAIVDTSEKVARLLPVADAQRHFNADVVEVNRGLAAAYREHTQRGELPSGFVVGISEQEQWAPPAPVSNRF